MWYRKSQVLRLVLISERTLERMLARKEFPQPVQLSRGVFHWFKPEVNSWIRERLGYRTKYLEESDPLLEELDDTLALEEMFMQNLQTLPQEVREAIISYASGGD